MEEGRSALGEEDILTPEEPETIAAMEEGRSALGEQGPPYLTQAPLQPQWRRADRPSERSTEVNPKNNTDTPQWRRADRPSERTLPVSLSANSIRPQWRRADRPSERVSRVRPVPPTRRPQWRRADRPSESMGCGSGHSAGWGAAMEEGRSALGELNRNLKGVGAQAAAMEEGRSALGEAD